MPVMPCGAGGLEVGATALGRLHRHHGRPTSRSCFLHVLAESFDPTSLPDHLQLPSRHQAALTRAMRPPARAGAVSQAATAAAILGATATGISGRSLPPTHRPPSLQTPVGCRGDGSRTIEASLDPRLPQHLAWLQVVQSLCRGSSRVRIIGRKSLG